MKVGDLVRVKPSYLNAWPANRPTTGTVVAMHGNGVEMEGDQWADARVLEVVTEDFMEQPQALRHNGGKPELSYVLTFPDALREVARVSTYGADKYERGNYLKGAPLSQSVDCLLRHLLAWSQGEDTDPESGHSHLGHVVWNALRLCQESIVRPDLDDRIAYKLVAK